MSITLITISFAARTVIIDLVAKKMEAKRRSHEPSTQKCPSSLLARTAGSKDGGSMITLGGSNGIHTIEDVFKRLTFSKIGDLGTQVLETAEKVPLLEREKERKAKGIIVG